MSECDSPLCVDETEIGEFTIHLSYDEHVENPRDDDYMDSLGSIYTFVKNDLPLGKHDSNLYRNDTDAAELLPELLEDGTNPVIIPLDVRRDTIHIAGLTECNALTAAIAAYRLTGDEDALHDNEDVQGIDTLFVLDEATLIKEYGSDTPENRKMAIEALKGELDTFTKYINGEVYGWIITDAEGDEKDSCWGYYGQHEAEIDAKERAESLAASQLQTVGR